MRKLFITVAIVLSSLTLAQTTVTSPFISLELPLVDLLDHLNIRAWRFGVATLPGTALNVELIHHERNSEGNFDSNFETQVGQTASTSYNDVGPQIVSVMMSPEASGTKVTIKLNDTTSYQSVTFVDLSIFETGFGSANGTYLSPSRNGDYILLAHYKTNEVNGVNNITATGNPEDMVSYISLKITVE
ncbi:hypothetical protein BH24DEI2_BH24DEI2_08080 [soil metagenome]